jgi:hypothetical protein
MKKSEVGGQRSEQIANWGLRIAKSSNAKKPRSEVRGQRSETDEVLKKLSKFIELALTKPRTSN